MAEFPPDDLGQEIDRLWAKVGSSASHWEPSLSAPAPQVTGNEVAWETMALLKRQHQHETAYWAEVLEAKERSVRASAERLAFLELEVNRLRETIRNDEARFISDGVDLQSKAESALKTVEEEREKHAKESSALRALLDAMRERTSNENAALRRERELWDKKEQQYLLDLRELQALAARRDEERGQNADQVRGLSQSLKEAKNAIEKTLSELLKERAVREESEREREKALKKVDEVQKHFAELSKIWEEERAQWRELWDRERSTWETQRAEFSAWEDELRKEREAWLAEVKAKEQDQARFTEAIGASLRESAEATSKMTSVLKSVADDASRRMPAWLKNAALACLAGCATAYPVWRYATHYHFKPQVSRSLDLGNPTAAAYDGNFIWISEWDGALQAFDPRDPASSPARKARMAAGGPFRPVAIAFGAGNLWALDAAQARIVRLRAEQPSAVVLSRPSPGPAPTALAFDGESLWSFDAANKALYRHGQDEGITKAFALGEDVIATAMAWTGAELWLADAKSHQLLVFAFKGERFKLKGRYDLTGAMIGLAPVSGLKNAGRSLWVLAGPAPQRAGHALLQYSY